MLSRAMILHDYKNPFREGTIEIRKPEGDAVVVKVAGVGICQTDIRIWKGVERRDGFRLPFVLGHEIAGYVQAIGDRVFEFRVGDPVIVYAIWPDLTCAYCKSGLYMLCKPKRIPGQSFYEGGFSEFLYVPSYRFLQNLGKLNPSDAAPLADAGVTAISAVKKIPKNLPAPQIVLLYGFGAVASICMQILHIFSPSTRVIAVSRNPEKLKWAEELGACRSCFDTDLPGIVEELTGSEGVSAAIDFVGNSVSSSMIADSLGRRGAAIVVGQEGPALQVPTFNTVAWEHSVIGSSYGTIGDLSELINLAERRDIRTFPQKRRLDEINEAFAQLANDEVNGRIVLTP